MSRMAGSRSAMKRTSVLLVGLVAAFAAYSFLSSSTKMENKLRSELRARVNSMRIGSAAEHAKHDRDRSVVHHQRKGEERIIGDDPELVGDLHPQKGSKAWFLKKKKELTKRLSGSRSSPDEEHNLDQPTMVPTAAVILPAESLPTADDDQDEDGPDPLDGELPQDEAGDDANGDQDATKRKDSLVAPLKASTPADTIARRAALPARRAVDLVQSQTARMQIQGLRTPDEEMSRIAALVERRLPGHAGTGKQAPVTSRLVPQSTEKMAWGVSADANTEFKEYQHKQKKHTWVSEQPAAREDGLELQDDGSCPAPGYCRPHGVCLNGPACKEPRPFPRGLSASFEGDFIITRKHVMDDNGVNFTTNPKAGQQGHGSTHTLFAPLVDTERKATSKMLNGTMHGHPNAVKSVITPSMLQAFDEHDLLASRIYRRCAIVGSSGLSMIYEDGPEIDSHDAIIRFNSAPTRPRRDRDPEAVALDEAADFPKHVGNKTTFRFINTQHIPWYEGNEIRLQQLQSKSGLFRYLQYKTLHPEAALHAFDTDFTKYVSQNIINLPTGGYFAIMLALQKCTKVSIYGFHWLAGHAIPHHYFNSEVPLVGKSSIHDYASEYENIKALAQEELVNLAQPCVAGCEAETHIKCARCAPGSTCGCGDNLPTPLSLPGFCHMKRNYTCFYKCASEKECPGGAKSSRCLRSFDPVANGQSCAEAHDVSEHLRKHPPLWARASWDPLVVAAAERKEKEDNLKRDKTELRAGGKAILQLADDR